MERKGFTLVELLVVIAVLALLLGILMPALARARQLAYRVVCGANLYGLGRAMLAYAQDNEDKLPRAGGRSSTWGPLPNWQAWHPRSVYGLDARGEGGQASIGSCFYLLVKYAEVTPKSFVCRSDKGTTEFKLSGLPPGTLPPKSELTDFWDFGPVPDNVSHYSYSYHMPFGLHALKASGEPGLAVAADRNPWLKGPAPRPSRSRARGPIDSSLTFRATAAPSSRPATAMPSRTRMRDRMFSSSTATSGSRNAPLAPSRTITSIPSRIGR